MDENKITGQHINHMKRLLKKARSILENCHNGIIEEPYNNNKVQDVIINIDDFLGDQ